jgi:RNA polymerase sigma factor (sigma-70 family)
MAEEIQYNLVRKIAWSFHRTTGWDYDDLYQQGCVLYLEAMSRYDPSSGTKFTTFAWIHMRNQLSDYVYPGRNPDCSLEDSVGEEHDVHEILEGNLPDPEHVTEFAQEVMALSPAGQRICDLLFSNPDKFARMGAQAGRGEVKARLREAGLSWNQIWDGFRQVKGLANQRA